MAFITIVGAGMMGSAMSFPAADNNNTIRLIGTPLDRDIIDQAKENGWHPTLKRNLPKGVVCYHSDEAEAAEAIKHSDLLICGVSSFGVEWFLENILKKLPKNLPVLSVTKGLHKNADGSLISFPDYYKQKLNNSNLSLNCIGGPCTSYELVDGNHTQVAFCGNNMSELIKIKDLLSTNYYHITTTTDVIGLETAVAMKNAYALGVSLAIGMAEAKKGVGCTEEYNPQAGLFFQSVREMTKIISLNGGDSQAAAFGIGDLYVTVFGGRTRRIGTLLGRGIPYSKAKEMLSGITLESVTIAQTAFAALKEQSQNGKADLDDYPLLCHINELLNDKLLNIPWKKFTV